MYTHARVCSIGRKAGIIFNLVVLTFCKWSIDDFFFVRACVCVFFFLSSVGVAVDPNADLSLLTEPAAHQVIG